MAHGTIKREDGTEDEITLFVDNGATFNIISESTARKTGKEIHKSAQPLVISLGLEQREVVERKYIWMDLDINNVGRIQIPAFILPVPEGHDVLLGMDFLEQMNPLIDWKCKTMMSRNTPSNESDKSSEKRLLHYMRKGHTGRTGNTKFISSREYKKTAGESDCMFIISPAISTDAKVPGKAQRFGKQGWDTIKKHQPDVYDILIKHKGKCFREKLEVSEVKKARDQGIKHEVELMNQTPITSKQFRLSPEQRKAVQEWTNEMLEAGVIRQSRSPWNSPIFCVRKPVGWRIVHDYRRLNAKTIVPQEPMPLRMDILDAMSGAQWFTGMDLLSGYYQLLLRESDIPYTAFSTPLGHFEYVATPMGLCGAPATFNRFVTDVLRDMQEFCRSFSDDIFIFTKSAEKHEHLLALDRVLDRCDKMGVFIKISKCIFAAHEIPVLGDFIGRNGLRMDPDKIKVIREWPVPTTKRQMKSFLGTVVYNAKYCANYGKLVAPLHGSTRNKQKNEKICLDEHQLECFHTLKQHMSEPPVLAIPNFSTPFMVRMDASDFAIGGALLQKDVDGDQQVVAYGGRKLTDEELNYDVRERELLAILYATRIWRPYLLDGKFIVETDHQSLQELLTQKKCTRRLARWLDEMADFPITFRWIKGSTNILADGISRRSDFEPEVPASVVPLRDFLRTLLDDEERMLIMHAKGPTTADLCRKWYPKDPFTKNLLSEMIAHPDREGDKFSQHDGLIYYSHMENEKRLVLPRIEDVLNRVMFLEHDELSRGHPGGFKTLHFLQEKYFWSNMKRSVDRYVATCAKCKRNKTRQTKPPGRLHPLDIPGARWERITMDFIVKLPVSEGHDSVWVIVDRLTKRIMLIGCSESMTAQEAARIFIDQYQKHHGLPKEVTSDRDKLFTSKFWETIHELQQTTVSLTTAYRKTGDGQSERCNRFIEDFIRNYLSPKEQNWHEFLSHAEFAFNRRTHTALGMSPFEADIGYNPPSVADLNFSTITSKETRSATEGFVLEQQVRMKMAQDSIAEAQVRMKKYYDKNRPVQKFKINDEVLLDTTNLSLSHMGQGTKGKRKFGPKFIGPFKIIEVLRRDTYKLKLPPSVRLHPYFHTSKLRPDLKDPSKSRKNVPAEEVLLSDGTVGRLIEKLIDVRQPKKAGTEREFRVRWAGCGPRQDLWYPESELKQVQGLMNDLLEDKNTPKQKRQRK